MSFIGTTAQRSRPQQRSVIDISWQRGETPNDADSSPSAAASCSGEPHWTQSMPMSGLVPQEITHAETQVVNQAEQITEASRARAEACCQYMKFYWGNLNVFLAERRLRVEAFSRQLQELLSQNPGLFTAKKLEKAHIAPFFAKETRRLRGRRSGNKLDEFENSVRIGRGGFAAVFLVRHRQSGQVYALKRMLKQHIRDTNNLDSVTTERHVLAAANSRSCEWIPQLQSSFQDAKFLYLVMEFLPGGDFRTMIMNVGFFPEEHARFYVCEMVTAIGHLHRMGFVHRDLKPDNFLIDRHGHVKLADFGLSKAGLQEEFRRSMKLEGGYRLTRRRTLRAGTDDLARKSREFLQNRAERRALAYSAVGSPDYMAPELLEGEGYSYSVDWWSLGCILFEMLVGVPPFFGETPEECFANLANHQKCLLEMQEAVEQDPEINMSADAWDIVLRLLCPANQRLGGGASDPPGADVSRDPSASAKEVLSVGWFSKPEYCFDASMVREMDPPFVPKLDADDDLTYFEDLSDFGDQNLTTDGKPSDDDPPSESEPGVANSTNQGIVEALLKNRESVVGFAYEA